MFDTLCPCLLSRSFSGCQTRAVRTSASTTLFSTTANWCFAKCALRFLASAVPVAATVYLLTPCSLPLRVSPLSFLSGTLEQSKYRAKVAFMRKHCEAPDPFIWEPKLPDDLVNAVKWSAEMDDTQLAQFWEDTMKRIEDQAAAFIDNGSAKAWFDCADPITSKVGSPSLSFIVRVLVLVVLRSQSASTVLSSRS